MAETLPSSNCLVELETLSRKRKRSKHSLDVWMILRLAETAAEFEVALDFAMEHDLVPQEMGGQVRDTREGQSSSEVWVSPIDGSEMVWIPSGPFFVGEKKRA